MVIENQQFRGSFCLSVYCMINGFKNHLLKLKKVKKDERIRIIDGFECLL